MGDPNTPDLTFVNANIITLDSACPHAEAVAIYRGRILGVGDSQNIAKPRSSKSRMIDCRGKTILPGFIDAHLHLFAYAESLVTLNLGPRNHIRSISDIQAAIQQQSQNLPPGSWIRGMGYNEYALTESRHPHRWDLDKASSVHPVRLAHRTGHAHVLNTLALERVGISRETPDPEGGLIERDIQTGEPTGLLYEMGDFLSRRIPPLDQDQMDHGMKIASRELISMGTTSVQDASHRNDLERWRMLEQWKSANRFEPRVSMMIGIKPFLCHGINEFAYQERATLSIGGIKIMLDETTGALHPGQDELNETVSGIHQSGLQAVIHAIEESSVAAAVNSIEYALQRSEHTVHRHRIEHCSICPPPLVKRLASLEIAVVTQPSFIYYSGDRYLHTVPRSQMEYLYPIRSLMANGVRVAGSSDCPVVPANPMVGLYSAVSRMSENGNPVLPQEGITLLDAMKLYTTHAAWVSFQEKVKGTITAGKLADFVVLSDDPFRVPVGEISSIRVQMTVINGEVVWEDSF